MVLRARGRFRGAARLNRVSWAPPGGPVVTPAVLVDDDRLEANLRAMASSAARRGLGLRPHVKTHKSAAIARRDGEVADRWPVDARGRNT